MAAQLTYTARPHAGGDGFLARLIADARRVWRTHATFRETRAQLARLSIREREDIGLAGADLDAVARAAAKRAQQA